MSEVLRALAGVIVAGGLLTGPSPGAPVVVRDQSIAESSGLAASPSHPGVLWTINDSDNAPVVYGLDSQGRTVARLHPRDVAGRDWEAIAAWRDPQGQALIAVGDTGDNKRTHKQFSIEIIAEPAALTGRGASPTSVDVVRHLSLRYPDGAADAEAILIDPVSQRMFVVTKALLQTVIWTVPTQYWPGTASGTATLQRVGSLPISMVTDGVMLPSGEVLLRNYDRAFRLAPITTAVMAGDEDLTILGTAHLPRQLQGEGLAVLGSNLVLSSEGPLQALVSVPLADLGQAQPQVSATASAPVASSGSVAAATSAPSGSAGSGEATDGAQASGAPGAAAGSSSKFLLLGSVAGLLLLGMFGAAMAARRRGMNRPARH